MIDITTQNYCLANNYLFFLQIASYKLVNHFESPQVLKNSLKNISLL